MRKFSFAVVFCAAVQVCAGQPTQFGSEMKKYMLDTVAIARLQEELRNAKDDTSRVLIMIDLTRQYSNKLDSGIHYCFKTISLSRKINFQYGELTALSQLENALRHHGLLLKAFSIAAVPEKKNWSMLMQFATNMHDWLTMGFAQRTSHLPPQRM